jgi:predicted XRE-type DNA-binding protein
MTEKFTRSSGNVFRDLGFESLEAEDLKRRSDLMIALRERIAARGKPQSEIATVLGVTQPRVSDLMRGQIHLFSLDTLVTMLSRLGTTVDVTIRTTEPGVADASALNVVTYGGCSDVMTTFMLLAADSHGTQFATVTTTITGSIALSDMPLAVHESIAILIGERYPVLPPSVRYIETTVNTPFPVETQLALAA